MSRLRAPHQASKIQPEVVDLVHNEVISLCQKMYTTIAGIEIDGIICISLLDTKEQQVVKIHKTLKSVVADAARKVQTSKSSAYPRIACMLSDPPVNDSPQTAVNSRNGRYSASNPRTSNYIDQLMGQRSDVEAPDFRKDISYLNDLLHANAMLGSNMQAKQMNKDEPVENKKGKRKRKKTKEISDNLQGENRESKEKEGRDTVSSDKDSSSGLVIIKEEPFDPSYEENANSVNIDQTYSNNSESRVATGSQNSCEGLASNHQSEKTFDNGDSRENSAEKENTNENCEIKEENMSQDADYGLGGIEADTSQKDSGAEADGGSRQSSEGADNSNDMAQVDWLYPEYSGQDKEQQEKSSGSNKHWLFGIGKNPRKEGEPMSDPETQVNEASRSALMNKFYREGSIAQKGDPSSYWQGQHQQKDPLGRSWIEMVKDNVSKYQAALMRSANKKEDSPARSASELLKNLAAPNNNANYLKSLLKMPAVHGIKSNEVGGASEGTQATHSISDKSRSTSLSPAPEIKIEIDEEPEYSQQVSSKDDGDKPPSGKLESRYPALFNQLQQAKQSTSTEDQNDSLVNRLPFISFQELFAPANPRMSESTTRDLLEKAKISPYTSKTNIPKKRSIWKWKKRQVKPKYDDVASSYSPDEEADRIAKRIFSRKRPKAEYGEDTEWKPSGADLAEDEMTQIETEGVAKKKIKTRLSTGEKQRVNFAEIENSDFEVEEEDEFEIINDEAVENPIQLVSAYCNKKCGLRFDSFIDLKLHEENCTWNGEAVPVGEAIEANVAEGLSGVEGMAATSGENFKCTICGLEFNQEYRRHYHMVKVHGMSAEKSDLFR